MSMATLVEMYGITTIVIVLLVAIPAIVKFITWLVKLIKSKKNYDKDLKEQGAKEAQEKDRLEARLKEGDERMTKIEIHESKMEEMLEHQQQEISLLIKSDELDIKAYIIEQYNTFIPKKCIDAEIMDTLEQRFQIYKLEGGNGFAERMMNELRSLPIVTRGE